MTSPAILDTNIILRYLLDDDPELSAKAADIVERIKSGAQAVTITSAVLIECVFVLQKTHGVPRDLIVDNLFGLLSLRGVSSEGTDLLFEALAIYRDSNLSIVDSILLTIAQKTQAPILTFDQQLAKRYSRLMGQG